MIKSLGLGLLSAFFFSFTFILNREMGIEGGHWLWSASLRFLFMFILLGAYLLKTKALGQVFYVVRQNIGQWFLWSFIGFGVFYSLLTYASSFTESWLLASTWQVTIIAGALLTPFTSNVTPTKGQPGKKLPYLTLFFSSIIIVGVLVVNLQSKTTLPIAGLTKSILPVIVAAFAYPLGNRKTMTLSNNQLTTLQRLFAMTLSSMPLWLFLVVIAISNHIPLGRHQLSQSIIVAIFSGVLATTLLFKACERVRYHDTNLAIIEATQSMEVVFTLLGGVLLFNHQGPNLLGYIGLSIIVIGMTLNSLIPLMTQGATSPKVFEEA